MNPSPLLDRGPTGHTAVAATRLAAPHRRALGAAAGLILVEAALELARPWPLTVVVDQGLGGRAFPAWAGALDGAAPWVLAVLAALTVLGLTVAGALVGARATLVVGRTAERIGAGLRTRLVATVVDQPPAFFRAHRTAELVNRVVNDVRRVEDAVVAWWEVALPEAVVLVGTLALLVLIDPWLALAALGVCPALGLVIVHRRRAVRRAQSRARDREGALSEQVQDLVRNVRVVQAFGRQPEACRSFERHSQQTQLANVDALGVEVRLAPLADLVLAVGAAAVLVLGVVRVEQGAMTTGTLLVSLSYVAGLYAPMRALTSLAATLARAEASRERLAEVLQREVPETSVAPGRRTALVDLGGDVVLDSVSFGYGETPVLDEVSLRFAAGKVTALTGSTGAGKSTVLNLLLRFEEPWSGRVLVDGRDLAEATTRSVRRRIAYVPQESWFLDDTVRANIALGDRLATRTSVEAAARSALVSEFTDRWPLGLDTVVGESGLALSGGERKRLAIARAVVRRADLFLLDEPTAGLDDRAAEVVLAAVAACTAGRTVVVVTHDPRVVRWADEVVHLPGSAYTSPTDPVPPTDGTPALVAGRR